MSHGHQRPISGEAWQRLRKDAGLSVEALAGLLHCSKQTIYNIEGTHGQQTIGPGLRARFALALYPATRALLPMAEAYLEDLLKKTSMPPE